VQLPADDFPIFEVKRYINCTDDDAVTQARPSETLANAFDRRCKIDFI